MMPDNFCVFILTHRRPDNVITHKTLERQGYTGKIYIIIDNEDETADQYYEIFGDKVIMFDKKAVAETFDIGDNFDDRRVVVYARNACFDIAKELGIKYFLVLDDDYQTFIFRINNDYDIPTKGFVVKKSLDILFTQLLYFYKSINAKSIAISQGGDFIGGKDSSFYDFKLRRKCMNTFFCCVDRPFKFMGRINEDVNTYVRGGSIGWLFFTIPLLSVIQFGTQSNPGGLTDIYLDVGTYVKSFYTIIFSPSCTRIRLMGTKHKRLHHSISWKNAVPVILDEKYKKAA